MIIRGYSGLRSISNDGVTFGGYDPVANIGSEFACEGVLDNLRKLFLRRCDLALLDGNHEGDYLVAEIKSVEPLMKAGGTIVLDDVDDNWPEIRAVFQGIQALGLRAVESDGRVGIVGVAA